MSLREIPRTRSIRLPLRRQRSKSRRAAIISSVATAVAVAVVIGLPILALIGPYPIDPMRPDPSVMGTPPNATYWFGTDDNGRDVFARTIEAAKLDMPIALSATALALLVGVPIGLFATTGRLGDAVMRVVDAFAALPIIVIAIVAIKLMGGGATDVIIAIAIVGAPRFVRITRASAVSLRSARYVEAAIAIGCSPIRVAFNHIFRNAYGIVLVQATLTAAQALGTIAALNFLGVGANPPQPSWGSMISSGANMLIRGEWWAAAFPALAMLLVIASFNVIAGAIENKVERVEHAR